MTDFPFGLAAPHPEQRIRKSIMVPLAAAFATLLVAAVLGISWLVDGNVAARNQRTITAASDSLRVQLNEEGETLEVGLAGVTGSHDFAQPLRAGDRDRLLALAQPILQAMHEDGKVTHFYFGDTAGNLVLRVHAPEHSNGSYDRILTRRAARSGTVEGGLELGAGDALSLRAVAPYRDGGAVIGYVELGVEFAHIIDGVHRILGADVMVLLDKRRLERAQWERGAARFGWKLPWDSFPAVVVNDDTMTAPPPGLLRRIAAAPPDGVVAPGTVVADGRILFVASLPLTDAAGQRLGSLLVVSDRTAPILGSRLLIGAIALLSLGLGIALVLLFHRIVGGVERGIGKAIARLARANADLERVAYVACHELQEPLDRVIAAGLQLERSRARLDPEESGHVAAIADGARQLERTVGILEDYLDLDVNARRMEPVALDAVLAAALEKVQPLLPGDRVTAAPLPTVVGRPMLLARAFFCMLDFAVRARPPGRALQVTVRADGEEGNWHIRLVGVPAPVGNPGGESDEDCLDLATVRHIAHVHGGNLDVIAAIGDTVTLHLTLRVTAPPPATTEAS